MTPRVAPAPELRLGDAVAAAVSPGSSSPLGATPTAGGVNFSVFSSCATSVDLLFFDAAADERPTRIVRIDPEANHTSDYWHCFVPGVRQGQIYGYRAHGPLHPSRGHRFDASKVLLDPYGRAVVVPNAYNRAAACERGDNAAAAMKSVVVDATAYDWEGDRPLRRPWSQTIVYELHVRGFTRHPSSGVPADLRGTYAGLVAKLPYLQQLGITAVELMPVFQFDALDCPGGRVNYWGYSPVSFFAPHQAYSARRDPLGPVDEFRDMVKALHRAGIEVILDVVYSHTAEGDHHGPTLCFRGFENAAYYLLGQDRAWYATYSSGSNALNASHPVVRRLIVDSLRYWVESMHVDGFRLDLASMVPRDAHGRPIKNAPIVKDIESDPVLAGTKFIAESWDAAGVDHRFVSEEWKDWNGRFRDDVRSFVRGDNGSTARVADRLLGRPPLYAHASRQAETSVNFVACHDGFTLNDLVSYNQKHNRANGEDNRDGATDNRSWNCGVEGPTDDPDIEALRNRQVKNCLTLTLLSLGVPMIQMGDEMRRTQFGNNNAYCQDDETNWLDWALADSHADVLRFVQLLTARRLPRETESGKRRASLTEMLRHAATSWHGVRLWQPDWRPTSHSFAFNAVLLREAVKLHLLMNAYWEPIDFELPPVANGTLWRRWIDTSLQSPEDIVPWNAAPSVADRLYRAAPRSIVVLWARVGGRRMGTANH